MDAQPMMFNIGLPPNNIKFLLALGKEGYKCSSMGTALTECQKKYVTKFLAREGYLDRYMKKEEEN